MTSDPDAIDADEGKIKIGFRTQLGIMGALITLTAYAVTMYGQMATKQDVVDAIKRSDHPEVSARIDAVENSDRKQSQDIAIILIKLEEAGKKMDGVGGKVDFLTQQAVLDAHANPRTYRNAKTAAQKVRRKAEEEGKPIDPLEDVKGL